MDSAAAMIRTSRTQPFRSASRIIRPIRGSTGSRASFRPSPVIRPFLNAFNSASRVSPSAMLRASGGSMNGNFGMSPRPIAAICKMTEARLVRRISGSVNSGRDSKSSSEYSRMQMPSEVRPLRPLRWLADACEIGSIGSRCTLVPRLYREMRAVPGSMTYLMPGTVSEVSATLVASTTRRVRLEAARRSKTRCCSAADSREYSGRMSSRSRPASRSAVSLISRSPDRNTRMSPGPSADSSSIASLIACPWSASSSTGRYRTSTG